jgi:hypothetical protein
MKLLTTIAAVLISISAFSQDYVEYNEGTFTQNGEELSMEQVKDLTVLHKAGRGNVRRGNRFIRLDKNQNYRITNNIGSFVVGGAAGFFGVPSALVGGIYIPYWVEEPGLPVLFGVGAGLCAVSYKAFSSIALSPAGCLRKRDRQFNKVADKLNEAIKAVNQ